MKQVRNMEWKYGPTLAIMHDIHDVMQKEGVLQQELSTLIPNCTKSAVSKWFNLGQISGTHLAALLTLPLFDGKIQPSRRDIAIHGWREATSWIRRIVLGDTLCATPIKYADFLFLATLHLIDECDVDNAYTRLPEQLLLKYDRYSDDHLKRAEREWGTPFRLLMLEVNNGL